MYNRKVMCLLFMFVARRIKNNSTNIDDNSRDFCKKYQKNSKSNMDYIWNIYYKYYIQTATGRSPTSIELVH
jgi:hypothetical protein